MRQSGRFASWLGILLVALLATAPAALAGEEQIVESGRKAKADRSDAEKSKAAPDKKDCAPSNAPEPKNTGEMCKETAPLNTLEDIVALRGSLDALRAGVSERRPKPIVWRELTPSAEATR